jgi:hypothetical protein
MIYLLTWVGLGLMEYVPNTLYYVNWPVNVFACLQPETVTELIKDLTTII